MSFRPVLRCTAALFFLLKLVVLLLPFCVRLWLNILTLLFYTHLDGTPERLMHEKKRQSDLLTVYLVVRKIGTFNYSVMAYRLCGVTYTA